MKPFLTYTPGGHTLNMDLFWEYDINKFVPKKEPAIVVNRVVTMGSLEDWYAAFDMFGGIEGFAKLAKKYAIDLDDKDLHFMCSSLNLKKEQTACYKKKLLRKKLFNS